jgi:hypothetical protein
MNRTTLGFLSVLVFFSLFPAMAKADNELTQSELLEITKISLDDYTTNNPDHAKHVSGFKTITVKTDGKVTIYISHDGMTMTSSYYCVRQDKTFVCTEQ